MHRPELFKPLHGDGDRGLEIGLLNWLDEIGQDVITPGAIEQVRVVVCGHQDDRDRLAPADLPNGVDAVHVGHLDISDDQVGVGVAATLDQLAAVPSHDHDPVPQQWQGTEVVIPHAGLVVGDGDAESGCHFFPRGRVIKIVAPRPSSVPAAITPPWASMMRLAMAMPSPVPWVLVV